MSEAVLVEREDEVALITLNRPDRLNALDYEMAAGLRDRLQELAHDRRIASLIVTGAGRAFCAGGDLGWTKAFAGGVGPAFHTLASCFHQAVIEIAEMGKPVIAAVNGVAAGAGFSLSLACDFRVVDRGASLKQAYTSAGLCIDGSGTFLLPRLVGLARAMEIAAFDQPIDAERALSLGLATRLADPGRTLVEAQAMARELGQRSLRSFAMTKRLFHRSFETPHETQMEHERRAIVACAEDPEGREGLAAFGEKRKPDFRRARQS